MGMFDVLGVIWKGYQAGNKGKDLYNFAVSVAGLEVAEYKIEENQTSYIKDKSEANTKTVRANVIVIRDYLRTFDLKPPGLGEMTSMESMAKYQVSIAISNYASQLLFNIDTAISSGNLPEIDDRPWSSRRGGYVRLRDGARIMALQFEGIVRNKQKELKDITAYEARLFALAFSQDITDADLRLIQQDMDQQKSDEDSTVRTLTIFTLLANGSRKNYERFSAIIDAGDRANAKN